jgi:tRNA (guanine-N7-)-methyltransferase
VTDAATPTPEPRTFREKPVSFVRRSGRMSEAQDRAWSELAPHYVIDAPRDLAATSILPGSSIDPVAV